ncbi:hypothetical protein FACS1894211_14660 [Clostridia bacterium]|nr:hypothetical protein FACS1894211_14660 [Clostridia bacterium]
MEFLDGNGYSRVYAFTVDKTAPAGALTAMANGVTNETVTLVFADEGARGEWYKDGVLVGGYESGEEVTEDGEYRIVLTDRAGNATEYTFTIDTVLPEATLIGVVSGGKTGGSVTLKNPTEQAEVTAYKNGEAFEYAFGDTLTQEGSYRIVLADRAGNATEYAFEIVYAVNAAGTVVILLVVAAIAGGIAVVYLRRKRKAFKTKPKKVA